MRNRPLEGEQGQSGKAGTKRLARPNEQKVPRIGQGSTPDADASGRKLGRERRKFQKA